MASFAQIDTNNTVVQVISGVPVTGYNDTEGQDYINNILELSGTWRQTEPTSYLGSMWVATPVFSAYVPQLSAVIIRPLLNPDLPNNYNYILSAGNIVNYFTQNTYLSGYRLNYAKVNYSYDFNLDAFIQPKPYNHPSWIVDTRTGVYKPPIDKPDDGHVWTWNENDVNWTYIMPMSVLHKYWLSAAPDPATGRIPPNTTVRVNLNNLVGWYNSVSATLNS